MARFLALLLAVNLLGSQGKVVDLTRAVPEPAEWKIVENRSAGNIGTGPQPPEQKKVTVRLVHAHTSGEDLYFSIEIYNDRQLELEVPISLSSSLLENSGSPIRFRELFVSLGDQPDEDPISFKYSLSVKPISLFGSRSVPGTLELLSPGERITIHLKAELQSDVTADLGKLRVRISGYDVQLTPVTGGYKEFRTNVLALFATSTPLNRAGSVR